MTFAVTWSANIFVGCSVTPLPHPTLFFGRSLPFLILSIILKNKKNLYVGSFNYFSYTIQIRSNWYMDTGVHDLEVACFNSTWTNDIGSKGLSNRPIHAVLNTHTLDMILQLKYMPIVMNPTGNPWNAMVCDTPYLQSEFGDPRFFLRLYSNFIIFYLQSKF